MARPEKLNVDYFPHYIASGKKMSFITKKFGNDGYATWFILLEVLAEANHHYLDLRDEVQVMFLSDRCNVSEELLIEIIDTIVKFGEFDSEMWKHKIIWSSKFNESVEDAWKRRNTPLMSKEEIKQELKLSTKKRTTTRKKKQENAELVMPWDTKNFITAWGIWKQYKKEQHRFTYKGVISEQSALQDLQEISGGDEATAITIIYKSIKKGWKGLFELTEPINVKRNPENGGASTVSDDYIAGILADLQS